MKKVCESALFHQKNESYPQRGAENAQKDAVASKVYLTFDATAPLFLFRRISPFFQTIESQRREWSLSGCCCSFLSAFSADYRHAVSGISPYNRVFHS